MHPEHTKFLAAQRIATFRDEAARDRLLVSARRRAVPSPGLPDRQRGTFERLVARTLRLGRQARRPSLGPEAF